MHFEIARTQRRGDLQPDEAGANHHRAPGSAGTGDDGAAMLKAAQIVDMRQVAARDVELDRMGAGCEKQLVVAVGAATLEEYLFERGVHRKRSLAERQFDPVPREKLRRAQRE